VHTCRRLVGVDVIDVVVVGVGFIAAAAASVLLHDDNIVLNQFCTPSLLAVVGTVSCVWLGHPHDSSGYEG